MFNFVLEKEHCFGIDKKKTTSGVITILNAPLCTQLLISLSVILY